MSARARAPLFRKVLIANRGEIAVRIARGLKDLGIQPVAVFSAADRGALHVRVCPEAVDLGGTAAAESYLDPERIVKAALLSGAEAVHPGYGFLSEDADFARAVEAASLRFIGPPAAAMERMGDKVAARRQAAAAGVPVIPGSGAVASLEEASREALRVGYPLLVKAAAGGGGKGMRAVRSEAELAAALRLARSEAESAFGDGTVYLERLIERPHHIEVQVLGDLHGNLVHLGERECSAQRRHQKVLEEGPSPFLDQATRERMGEVAVRVAKSAGYASAGTCEFLVGPDRSFYFLEMNARLQVEHPVTEMITGIDLVEQQLKVAAGEALEFEQEDVRVTGHAVEARVYAEDPDRGYLPSPGRVGALREPMGPGVRVDSGIASGQEVPIHYDPILAKLVVWGRDRAQAAARLRRALEEYRVSGVVTNLGLLRRIAADPRWQGGDYTTALLDELAPPPPVRAEATVAAAVAAALHRSLGAAGLAGEARPAESRWKQAARFAILGRRP